MRFFIKYFKWFRSCEDGATTVDFVVLTAAVLGLAIAVLEPIGGATTEYADDSARCMTIVKNRITRMDGTAADYALELRRAERNCGRVR